MVRFEGIYPPPATPTHKSSQSLSIPGSTSGYACRMRSCWLLARLPWATFDADPTALIGILTSKRPYCETNCWLAAIQVDILTAMKDFKRGIYAAQWEAAAADMRLEDLRAKIRDLQLLHVTRDMQVRAAGGGSRHAGCGRGSENVGVYCN